MHDFTNSKVIKQIFALLVWYRKTKLLKTKYWGSDSGFSIALVPHWKPSRYKTQWKMLTLIKTIWVSRKRQILLILTWFLMCFNNFQLELNCFVSSEIRASCLEFPLLRDKKVYFPMQGCSYVSHTKRQFFHTGLPFMMRRDAFLC